MADSAEDEEPPPLNDEDGHDSEGAGEALAAGPVLIGVLAGAIVAELSEEALTITTSTGAGLGRPAVGDTLGELLGISVAGVDIVTGVGVIPDSKESCGVQVATGSES